MAMSWTLDENDEANSDTIMCMGDWLQKHKEVAFLYANVEGSALKYMKAVGWEDGPAVDDYIELLAARYRPMQAATSLDSN